jgi:hypothetical protein
MTSVSPPPSSPPEFGTKRKEKKRTWSDVLNESVHTSDDHDIGDIEAVSRNFVVVKRGYVNIHRYYIPIGKVEGWDGNVLWLKITEEEVKKNYERSNIPPNPLRYNLKDQPPVYSGATYPELFLIPVRYPKELRSAEEEETIGGTTPTTTSSEAERKKCDLCSEYFRSEDELAQHVGAQH